MDGMEHALFGERFTQEIMGIVFLFQLITLHNHF